MKYANHFLLFSLFIVFFLGPLAFDLGIASIVDIEMLFLFILISSVFLLKKNSKIFKLAVALLIVIIINNFLFNFNQSLFQYTLKILIITLTIFELFKQIIQTKIIDAGMVSGGISIYILIGVFWYLLFMALVTVHPNSFHFASYETSSVSVEMVYFSFITLTTLGYGDITPISYTAKMWAITEAITGVMYIAVMISRLVTLLKQKK
tara:strand:+ start:45 stop:665 length:621 start_codon:yes stop_codon:yes gene_type:complete